MDGGALPVETGRGRSFSTAPVDTRKRAAGQRRVGNAAVVVLSGAAFDRQGRHGARRHACIASTTWHGFMRCPEGHRRRQGPTVLHQALMRNPLPERWPGRRRRDVEGGGAPGV